ncbi:MAG: arginine--tRNA ligase [bacterium]|nr:arginine--tRNA ligase [bacterium]
MNIADNLKQVLARSLGEAGIKVSAEYVALARPKELSHGDYATGAALQYSKQVGMPPAKLAEKIVAGLGTLNGVKRVEVVAPGFINFHLTPDTINNVLGEAIANEEAWGRNDLQKDSRVMVEYTDPNPFKEFHIGHLMSNAIGESISRLVEYSGAEVKRANYQGDVGPHVAKAIWSIQKHGGDAHDANVLGKAYVDGSNAYESDAEAKAQIDALNGKIYDRSDPQVNAIYDAGCDASLKHFEEIYKTLGTKFDYSFFESETAPFGKKIVEEHPEIFEKSDGAIVYKGDEKKGLHTRVFINSKGLPTYEAKELGLAKKKHDTYPYDKSIVITGNEVNEYFRVLLDAMSKVYPDLATKTVHISHGMMRLSSGKMSSRTGDVITGESLIAELKERATARASESRADDAERLAEQIAVSAVKYQILRQASGKDIIFDRERALSLEGDSGPYLQYAHARAYAVVERAKSQGVTLGIQKGDTLEPNDVSRLVTRFPEVVLYAAEKLEPHLLANYLISLAGAFNSWYAQVHILDGTKEAPHKVAIVNAVRATLKNGLWLLGISAPEKM